MPVVVIYMWAGRTEEQKRKLVKEIYRAFNESLGTQEKDLHIVIQDVPKNNWGLGGKLASETS
jgi:4-oxalocrotonate tautomerase